MSHLVLPPILLTAIALVLLLVAEARDSRVGKWSTKPLASAGFVWLAVARGAADSAPGRAILVGLCLCWLGDVLLIPRNRAAFLAGLVSFLLGHLGFVVAFLRSGVSGRWMLAAAVPLVILAAGVLRWLWPHLSAPMRGPVVAYVAVITAMVAAAAGLAGTGPPGGPRLLAPVGATLFFLSDLCVARNRFVAPGFANRLIGLPLYYTGVVLIALSAGG